MERHGLAGKLIACPDLDQADNVSGIVADSAAAFSTLSPRGKALEHHEHSA
jgi:hypothetical protein